MAKKRTFNFNSHTYGEKVHDFSEFDSTFTRMKFANVVVALSQMKLSRFDYCSSINFLLSRIENKYEAENNLEDVIIFYKPEACGIGYTLHFYKKASTQ